MYFSPSKPSILLRRGRGELCVVEENSPHTTHTIDESEDSEATAKMETRRFAQNTHLEFCCDLTWISRIIHLAAIFSLAWSFEVCLSLSYHRKLTRHLQHAWEALKPQQAACQWWCMVVWNKRLEISEKMKNRQELAFFLLCESLEASSECILH